MPFPNPVSVARRSALVVGGAGVSAYGYLVTVGAKVGNGPLFAVQDGVAERLGLSLGTSAALVGLAVVALAAALRAPLGPATLTLPVVTGSWISVLEAHVPHVEGVVARWSAFLGGTSVMMLGGVLVVRAALGASALDGVMLGLSRRIGATPARTRLAMELSMAGTGAALGGRVGAGTVVMGATVGHLFAFWSRLVPGGESPRRPVDQGVGAADVVGAGVVDVPGSAGSVVVGADPASTVVDGDGSEVEVVVDASVEGVIGAVVVGGAPDVVAGRSGAVGTTVVGVTVTV